MKHQAHYFIRPFAILLASLALVPKVQAAGWQVVETLAKSPGNQYGEAVAVSKDGNIAAVTQAVEPCTDGKEACGAVYVYIRQQGHWNQQAKLYASDAIKNTRLGGFDYNDRTVALNDDGTVLAVATNWLFLAKGVVYVFVRNGNTWSEQQKLTLPTNLIPAAQACGETWNDFGRSLALSGDGKALIVGVTNECLATNTGAAYLFTKSANQWTAQTRLVGSGVDANTGGTDTRYSSFGMSVDISGDGNTLLVSSKSDRADLRQAYIFSKNNTGAWVEKAILKPTDNAIDSGYGFAVALNRSGNTALVGDYGRGAAYVYSKTGEHNATWKQEAKLGANITQRSFAFGFSLDLDDSGTQAVVGDWGGAGAFLYTRLSKANWQPQWLNSLPGGGNGSSITISGDAKTILDGGPGRFTTFQQQ